MQSYPPHSLYHQVSVRRLKNFATPLECNFHILRYCNGKYEVHKREIIKEFMNHILELRDKAEIYKIQEKTAFDESDYLEGK